jgi:hypothetical protein
MADMELQLNDGFATVIDSDDFDKIHEVHFMNGLIWRGSVLQRSWRVSQKPHTNYAICLLTGSFELRLHRVLLDAKADQIVDHIDGNGLNNRRSNLRLVDTKQNARNRNPNAGKTTKGVSYHRNTGKWSAQIRVGGKKIHLGLFITSELAQAAYNAAAQRHFGEFAKLVQP